MKQYLLLTLFVLTGFGIVSAQQTITRASVAQNKSALNTSFASTHSLVPTGDKLVLDTVVTAALNQSCADTLTAFVPSPPATGFVSGTNSFFDLEKLQLIELPEATNFTVSTGLAAFIAADSTIGDREIFMNVYAYDRPDNPLGAYLGSSDTLLVRDLIVGTQFTQFPFSTPVVLENASSFIIGVEFTNLYFDDRDSVNYVGNAALFATNDGCGNGLNSFEIFRDATTGNIVYSTIFDNWGMLNSELAVGAVIDRAPFVSTRTPLADYDLTVSPNPATDQLNISFSGVTGQSFTASLMTTDGRQLRTKQVIPGATTISWDVSDLPAGVYLYQLAGVQGVQTGKVVIR